MQEQRSNSAASNSGRDEQLSAITSLNQCAQATLISLIMNNGGGNREACLCKFPHTVISFMLDSRNSGETFKNNQHSCFSLCFYFPFMLFSMCLPSLLPLMCSVNPSVPYVSIFGDCVGLKVLHPISLAQLIPLQSMPPISCYFLSLPFAFLLFHCLLLSRSFSFFSFYSVMSICIYSPISPHTVSLPILLNSFHILH